MRITDRVAIVGSGQMGMRMTHPLDCNVYLIDGGAECALVDAGGGVDPDSIIAQVQSSGVEMESVRYLLLTHAHADHAAGARYFQEQWGMQVICAHEAVPWMEDGDVDKISLPGAKVAGIYPQDFQFPPCPIARGVGEGDIIRVGSLSLEVIETPGHSRGHVSFLLEEVGQRALFSGDIIFPGGKIALLNAWDTSLHDYSQTMAKLHARQIERLYPGDGPVLMFGAYDDIERAHSKFQRLAVPSNLV